MEGEILGQSQIKRSNWRTLIKSVTVKTKNQILETSKVKSIGYDEKGGGVVDKPQVG